MGLLMGLYLHFLINTMLLVTKASRLDETMVTRLAGLHRSETRL